MSVRQRERIHRNDTEEETCQGCGASMLDVWSRTVRVAGERLNLCSTCQGEARKGVTALKAYLRAHARHYPDEVNDDLLNRL